MPAQDIRWIQRFNNFEKALNQLTKFIEKGKLALPELPGSSTRYGGSATAG